MKLIDFERKGNVIRFYIGADDCTDYRGDGWDDAPYEFNAGTVYEEYIKATVDVAVPFDCVVYEPADDGYNGSTWSKENMKEGKCPCIVVLADKDNNYLGGTFNDVLANKKAYPIYFGSNDGEVLNNLTKRGCLIFNRTWK